LDDEIREKSSLRSAKGRGKAHGRDKWASNANRKAIVVVVKSKRKNLNTPFILQSDYVKGEKWISTEISSEGRKSPSTLCSFCHFATIQFNQKRISDEARI